jgi:hypothetical protein
MVIAKDTYMCWCVPAAVHVEPGTWRVSVKTSAKLQGVLTICIEAEEMLPSIEMEKRALSKDNILGIEFLSKLHSNKVRRFHNTPSSLQDTAHYIP